MERVSPIALLIAVLAAISGCEPSAQAEDPPHTKAAVAAVPGKVQLLTVEDQKQIQKQRHLEQFVADGFARHPILDCIQQYESGGDYTNQTGDGGTSTGKWQFQDQTWKATVTHGGRPDLVTVRPYQAKPQDQDWAAVTLADWQGYRPWTTSRKCRPPRKAKPVVAAAPPSIATAAAVVGDFGAMWDEIAIGETGGNWAMHGSRCSGGLGFCGSWEAFGGLEFAPYAGAATREQQIIIAERINWCGGAWGGPRRKYGHGC